MENSVEVHYSPACKKIKIEACCGCGACASVCSKGAIKMLPSEEGFLYPVVEDDKCVKCGKCVNTCPIIHHEWMDEKDSFNDCFVGYANEEDDVRESSSGGFFYSIAKTFIKNGGEVYGVAWNKTFDKTYYMCASNLEDLEKLRKSKYIQSEKGDVYTRIKKALDNNIKVLVSGCGCDLAALKNFLNGNDRGLYTVELICHGPTSPKYLREWNEYLSKKYKHDIVDLEMRTKKNGCTAIPFRMRVVFSNGAVYERNYFDTAFGYAFSNAQRPSCYQCRFKSDKCHVGDVTIGDAYGKLKRNDTYNIFGTSVIIVNTNKGIELFGMANNFCSQQVKYEDVLSGIPRLTTPWTKSHQRQLFSEFEKRFGLIKAVDMVCGKKRSLRFHLPEKLVFIYDSIVHGVHLGYRRVHVLIDFQALIMQRYGGVSHYTYEIVKGLIKDKSFVLHLPVVFSINAYFKDIIKGKTWEKPDKYLILYRLSKLVNLINTWIYLLLHKVDIYHPSYHMPFIYKVLPAKTKVIITVHDLIHEIFPGEANKRVIANRKKSLERADQVIVVSNNTLKDLLNYYPFVSEEKIHVIYEGGRTTDETVPVDGLPERYILFVGVRKGYKNFGMFYKAVTPILDQFGNLNVICVGGGSFEEGEIEEKYKSRIHQMKCSDEELNYVYQNAICFVFPSLYEGFGIPIIEAFENLCPVVLSGSSCFPEIAGDAALYFDSGGNDPVKDLAQKILLYISDEDLRSKMIEKGRLRAKQFTWDNMRTNTLELYRKLMGDEEAE